VKWKIWTPFLVIFSLPFMNYAALKFGEAGMDVLKSLPPLIIALLPGQQRSLDKLKAMRIDLSNQVASLINDFGPKLYDDFDEARILWPSASAPPSSGPTGLWRRKSSTGAVDAQGLGLTHPMTWIDERLFGWSRSSKRGTSAWGGHVEDPSRINTPDDSDEEDTGDYDNVVGVLGTGDEQSLGVYKSRSRQSSYADLQRLRMPPLTTQNGDESSRLSHRTRRASLGDGVPVSRIATVDRQEPFSEATQNLNEEISHSKEK